MGRLLLLFLGALKFAKFSKILLSGGTMLLSVLAYTLVFGWRYAAGFVGLIAIHEAGHYVAARHRGLDVGLPTFIPFVGAWVELKDRLMNVETEAYVAMAGPLAGTVGALGCYFLARHYDSALWLALAYAGFLLNLINLVPLAMMDGGRIVAILSPRIWLVGLPTLALVFFYWPSPILILIAIFAVPQVWAAWRNRHSDADKAAYYATPVAVRIEYGVYYLVLTGFLAVMSFELHAELPKAF
jgi:Zn-dependent protease